MKILRTFAKIIVMDNDTKNEIQRLGGKLTFEDKGKIMDSAGIKSMTSLNTYLAGKGPNIGRAKMIIFFAKEIINQKENTPAK